MEVSSLDLYRKKRDPDRTPEPFSFGETGHGWRFVIQQHGARNLHYDLRLEMAGVLKSWAVPKGPSVQAEEKRLAVQVEDHPLTMQTSKASFLEATMGQGRSLCGIVGATAPSRQEIP